MIRKSDIQKVDDKKREVKKDLYTKLYEQASRKIRQAVEFGQKQVIFRVPGYLLGYQPFDRYSATTWIHRQLKLGDFTVTRVDEYTLFISWFQQKQKVQHEKEEPEEEDFPTLVNLKKAANKNRKYFPDKH